MKALLILAVVIALAVYRFALAWTPPWVDVMVILFSVGVIATIGKTR